VARLCCGPNGQGTWRDKKRYLWILGLVVPLLPFAAIETNLPKTLVGRAQLPRAPRLHCYGIQRIHLLRDVVILDGAGVGGGSRNYANVS